MIQIEDNEETPNPLSILVMQKIVDSIMAACGLEESEPIVEENKIVSSGKAMLHNITSKITFNRKDNSNVNS